MKAILWGYKYNDMKQNWRRQMSWLVISLLESGIEVKPHPKFKCFGLQNLPSYDFTKDYNADICIYNHADVSCLTGNVLMAKRNWFFKPTVPTKHYTTLDELGYGPYSSIAYKKPDFEDIPDEEVKFFFATKVKDWIDNRFTKWGATFKNEIQEVEERDYHLVLGQMGADEVVTRHDFGHYFTKLEQVVRELVKIDPHRWVVVKLHPYTDGIKTKSIAFSQGLKNRLEVFGPTVKVYTGMSNIHNFIKNAYCVHLANSGAGFEVMMHHKPIIAWGFPEYHWVTYDLRHLADLNKAIKLEWFDSNKADKFLYWYMEKYCFYDQKTSDRRVKELLDNG